MRSDGLYNGFNFWNRKIHIHLGLFLLLFIWLFSFSGLLLNHSKWKISDFYEKREQTEKVTSIRIPPTRDSGAIIKDIMAQLQIQGEVTNVKMEPDKLHFRVSIPGKVTNLEVDLRTGICIEKAMQYNLAGKIRTLHMFNGVDKNNADQQPNWFVTRMWRLSMDGIAIGFMLLCFSSWVLWFKIRESYRWGWIVLISGFSVAGYFVFG